MMALVAIAVTRWAGSDVKIASHYNKDSNILVPLESLVTRMKIDAQQIADALFGMLDMFMNREQPAQKVVAIQARLLN